MNFDELCCYYALALSDGIGARRLIALRTHFGNAERAFAASESELATVSQIGKGSAKECAASRVAALRVARTHLKLLPEGVSVMTFFDNDFPLALRNTFSPPAILFLHGERSLLSFERNIAVVGTRRMTDYGKRITTELCTSFATNGVTVTSGLALGVDTAAHRAVFDGGGTTIAVLGSGIDVIYPTANKLLAGELVASGRGLIVTEMPLGAKPDAKNFPARNRIISGLSAATVVIESDEEGGSMITASISLDENRDVFALPGGVDRPTSRGPNRLLTENRAKAFRNAEDILRSMNWLDPTKSQSNSARSKLNPELLTKDELVLYRLLEEAGEPIHIDAIVERASLDVQAALVVLLGLEFKDAVRQLPGKHFAVIN